MILTALNFTADFLLNNKKINKPKEAVEITCSVCFSSFKHSAVPYVLNLLKHFPLVYSTILSGVVSNY